MALDDDSDLFDPPARPKQPSNKIVYQPPGAQWSLDRLPEVESLYKSSFNKPLPLVNKGQGSIHNKWGYDHRNSADVSVNPATPEGQQFTEQLKKANVPFLAFTSAIPGVATGPHIHIGFPSHRTQQKFNIGAQKKSTTVASDDLFDSPQSSQSQQSPQSDDDLFDSPKQSTPRTSADTRKSIPPRATAASALADSLILPRGQRNQGANYHPTFSGQSPTAEDVLTDIGNQTTVVTNLLAQQSQGGGGAGELHRIDDPEVARIQRAQQTQLERNPVLAKLRKDTLSSSQAAQAAQQASQERADELQAQANEPQLRELTDAYRKEIRRMKGLGIGPEQWLNEAAAKGAAGLTSLAAGAFRGASPALAAASRLLGDPNRADIIALHAQAMQRAAEEEGADRNRVSKAIQNVIGGTISSAPEMGMIALGAPPMAAFGAGGATRALGEGKRPVEVARAGAHGVATGGAFQLPIPEIANPLARAATRAGVTGLATSGLESQTGAPLGQSIETGLTNALLSGAGELAHNQPSSLERGLARETPREQVEPDAVIAARLRGDKPANGKVLNEPQAQVQPPMGRRFTVSEKPLDGGGKSVDVAGAGVEFVSAKTSRPEYGLPAVIADIYLKPEAQRQGMGSEILSEILDRFRVHGDWVFYTTKQLGPGQALLARAEREGLIKQTGIKNVPQVSPEAIEYKILEKGSKGEPQIQTQPPVGAQRAEVESARAEPAVQVGPDDLEQPIASTPEGVQRFYHRDYGEVTESPNQKQVGKGRVRVVAEDGSEHVIKRAAMTGAGNQRAVPIREPAPEPTVTPPAELNTQPSATESQRVYYHGTGREFDISSQDAPKTTGGGLNRYGFFVSPERKVAERYAKDFFGDKGIVKEFELDVKKPLKLTAGEFERLQHFVGMIDRGEKLSEVQEVFLEGYLEPTGWKAESGIHPIEWIRSKGYDAIEKAAGRGGGEPEVMVFRPEQMKPRMTPKEVTDAVAESPLAPESQKPTSSIAPEGVRPSSAQSTTTAIKNAAMAADRAARDLPELAQAEPRKATEVHQRALDANARDPRSVDRLVQQALESDKNLTDVETAQLRLRAQEIKNRERELLSEIDSTTDPQTIREKRVELDSLTNEFDRLSQATRKAGTEWGRAGVARQQAINEDYSLVAMRARMKAAKGSELNEKEIADTENLHKRISDLEAQVAEANQRAEARVSAESVNKFIREHKLSLRKQARARTREGLQAERSDLKQQIAEAWKKHNEGVQPSGLASLDPEGELSRLVGKLARNYIEDGVTRAGDLVDAVHAHISDVADLTKREVSDLISGYGVIRKPSIDPVERKLNELKSILASQSGKADVVEQGIRPLRRGQQREKPTEDQRRALRELQDAMAQHPEISRGRPSEVEQLTPLDKAKTATRNRIEQLKSWIESGKKEVQGRAKVIPDAELTQLKAERDALQKVADLLDDPKADQRAVERRVSELSKSIAETRQRIQSGQVGPRVKEGEYQRWTPEIGQLEKERATLRQIAADMRKQPKTPEPKAPFYGATGSWAEYEAQARKTLAAQKAQAKRITSQIAEYERRATANDFGPRPKRTPIPSTPELDAARESLARAKNQFLRKEREFKLANRGPGERAADLLIRWGRAAKLSYVSTLGKLSGAATGRMVMSPLENLVGEIPHRLSPELSRRATVEGGGFDRAAEVAALWKSGRFKQMLNQITKGSSDLDVLYGGQKGIDKEMSSEGVLGYPGRVHGALKEFPRQAEFDRAFIKTLRNYERAGQDIADPQVQLAAKMEAYNSAERARFQQRNFISDEFNNAMGRWERKGGLAKGAAKVGRFVFPITRVPVNVAGETLNYTLGIPRAAIETAIRGGVNKLTPEQANNIMRAYKKGGVGLAIMVYAYLKPQQFGGYYQKSDRRGENEPAPGEVMFFGHRIPKWATHIPIIEAGQLAATVRRVSDKLREQGEDKSEATLGGVTAGAKGVASGIPFYETPARFFTGQEGARGWAEVVGQQGKGLIPGFVQESAQLMDKDAQGKPIKRRPTGSFAQRVGQTVELGIPGLRSRVPLNERAYKSDRKAELIEKFRRGEISKSDLAAEDLTPAERSAISRIGKLTERQARFSNFPASTALDRFERMDAAHQEEVREQMEKKAYSLTHSDTLTDQQKAAFRERLDRLGITPRVPAKSSGSFKDLFRQSASPF